MKMRSSYKKRKSKRSQEEMIGFVLIVVLVAIIALIFLAISARKPVRMQESKEIENFLHSSLLYTTDCKPSPEIIYDFKDLIKACLKKNRCLNGELSCDVLNETAFGLIEAGWKLEERGRYKAYIFKVYKGEETLVHLSRGEITTKKQGAEVYLPVAEESVYVRMEVFY